MTNISILAWDDYGGVTKIHNIITSDTSLDWDTKYINSSNVFIAVYKVFKVLYKSKVSRILVGNGREAVLVWICLLLIRTKPKVFYIQHTPLDHTPKYFRKLFRFLCRDFTVTTISYELQRKLKLFSHDKSHDLKVIYNPVLETESYEIKLHKLKGTISFLAIGRLSYQKNYTFMIELIKHLNLNNIEAELTILGEGEDHDMLTKQIAELGLNTKVRLAGYCIDVESYLNKADFFIMTSHWEGLPTSLIEALHSPARIVAYKCPTGVEEILTQQPAAKIVEELNHSSFYRAIRELMVLEGTFMRTMRQFNREFSINKYEELFNGE